MLLYAAAVVAGLALLVWSADRFITGAAALARLLRVSPLLIGLTVVAVGTSAPEVFVSALAAAQGQSGIAIGNVVGSNIANIGLILGLVALVRPLAVHSRVLRRELPFATAIALLATALVLDGTLTRLDGIVLLAALLALLTWLYRVATAPSGDDPLVSELVAEVPKAELGLAGAIAWTVAGLLALAGSAQLLIWGAAHLASAFGVSDLVIGLTIVALGTSLPELAASMAGALKGEDDLAVGNVLGSNMFNLLLVLPLPALIAPGPIPAHVLERDMVAMVVLTLALFAFCIGWRGHAPRIGRIEGAALLAGFSVYQLILLHSEIGA